ncbi:fumarylacetoacetate hydrolase family protein [Geomicrobium sp. JCM 19039]|uniref:fumarylacetoacetate hydrolase family protein n=1 Tax=Geomicrobium sp. JCM 19039 TaxID=1460636 RepID=UPI00045F164D|nr:fumarylacetoacetate hydrolase family protein [Geomicrobium sp. JCM 19039]GAK11055.1 predicted 2-keto-4-pentenoate hydratase/2-oxohepta-3-ene-1,7-dioic acid hydratase [Geomicrobium sp. JCM 19039]
MKLVTVIANDQEKAGILLDDVIVPIECINDHDRLDFEVKMKPLIENDQLSDLARWVANKQHIATEIPGVLPLCDVTLGPLYRNPEKIWGIGLNYVDHAADLNEVSPNTEPASFMKPVTTIIGPGETIRLPPQSERTTGEAELGIIIGKTCKDVEEHEAFDVIAGYTTIIDMTAEDILEKNPRYLTRAKSFDTFFSFGPVLLTRDEVEDLHSLEVRTMHNGELHRKNTIANMTFSPEMLVSFHSKVMTLNPGDIISTGTPGAVHLREADIVGCEIDGFLPLTNPVKTAD